MHWLICLSHITHFFVKNLEVKDEINAFLASPVEIELDINVLCK